MFRQFLTKPLFIIPIGAVTGTVISIVIGLKISPEITTKTIDINNNDNNFNFNFKDTLKLKTIPDNFSKNILKF